MAPSLVQAAFTLILAGSAFADLWDKRDGVISTNLPGNWTSQGCYTDPGGVRALSAATYTDTTGMTEESCISYCDGLGYNYAGTEYSQECYCANFLSSNSMVASASDCSMTCKGNSTELCGGPNRLNVFWNGKLGPQTNPGPVGWGFYGCYVEGTTGRALPNGYPLPGGPGNNTVANCISTCSQAGYSMSGVEYSDECYCGNSLQNNAAIAPIGDCSMTCSGNGSEFCGAGNRLDVYSFGYTAPSTMTVTVTVSTSSTSSPSVTTTTSSSVQPTTTSSSTTQTTSSSSTTTTTPTSTSKATTTQSSTSNASTTKTSTSQTSTTKPSTTTTTTTKTSTTKTSTANTSTTKTSTASTSTTKTSTANTSTTKTSTANTSTTKTSTTKTSTTTTTTTKTSTTKTSTANTSTTKSSTTQTSTSKTSTTTTSTSKSSSTTSKSSSSSSSASPASTSSSSSQSSSSSSTSVTPTSSSQSSSSTTSSSQSSSSTTSSSQSSSSTTSSSQSSSSTTSSSQSNSSTTSSQTSSSTTSSQASSSTTSSQTSLATGGFQYAGCYTEGVNGQRALGFQQPGGDTNTVENCISTCIGLNYTVAGLEYSSQCFCDNDLYNGASKTAESNCNMPCAGNSTGMCGAGNILSIYNTGNLTIFQPPASQNSSLPGNWTYEGCWTDANTTSRALIWQSILTKNNSATTCLNLCAEYGYMAAGTEYGEECYCGDDSHLLASGSTKAPESDCSIVCSGDNSYFCGGNSRLSYYRWTGTPLNVWNTPSGADMGSYEFFIGGVVVPLITTTGINNKVVFMEKSGTGAPNTTGTYELDLAQVNNFAEAWRPLHVKTDIFCSAGVTLPDKAGRQLNIGGWSGSSTYGVRLYWPDGSPGTPGVNDWQENVNELSLLAGRWYPSALVMANGSVLIMGGEVGSNSAPTPSCEILPAPAGGYAKYLDWLDRTDPNNLYPFMFVLPSGGIFIVYYNEARILDEGTFDTIKTLPNLPGSVINFLAGRTYPLEGTAVLLPQYPPYSDPVTVLVCGGSANGAAMAIDNCVSTQPEVANPTWTIERMPSQRVMSCICALPDGTYLILNGAQQGVAGFGLATNPNYNAILYDPTLPVQQRFSIMATTIVARLYHSEAILLPDGRVLVSGSDPEDGTHPQEYRVEVFNPPYALSGAAAPSFTIANVDWTYGASDISLDAVIPSGNLGGVRVSMMAAVSSTHGNSLGQRTLFLDVSCSGSSAAATCVVTAPPSAHVAPPGWYQIFVLDGKRPGSSHWIRIGGSIADAAGLGNWPAASDFNKPGLGPVTPGAGSYNQ